MRINWRGFCVIGIAFFLLFNVPLSMAESFSSASFKIKDATFDVYGGLSTSTSFRNISAGGQAVAGTASSGSFKGEVGILYFEPPVVEPEPTPTPTAVSGGGLIFPRLLEPVIIQVVKIIRKIPILRRLVRPDADLNGDFEVDLVDVSILLHSWGKTAEELEEEKPPLLAGLVTILDGYRTPDLNSDGIVNLSDMSILLSNWTA